MKLTPEQRKRLAEHVGAEESVADEALAESLLTEMDARKSDIESLTKAKLDLSREVGELKKANATLELERSTPNPPSEREIRLISSAHRQERQLAIAEGVISEACANEIDAPFFAGGKPTTLALSMAGADDDTPIVNHIYQALRKHKGGAIKHNNAVERTTIAASRDGNAIDVANADSDPAKEAKEGKEAGEDFQKRQLAARGMT